jgi:hypothetical protein
LQRVDTNRKIERRVTCGKRERKADRRWDSLAAYRAAVSFNAGHEPLPEAGAERTLEAVGSMPWFGEDTSLRH